MNKALMFVLMTILALTVSTDAFAQAQKRPLIRFVEVGDEAGLIQAIQEGNEHDGRTVIFLQPGESGETEFVFEQGFGNTMNALPVITGNIELTTTGDTRPTLRAGENNFRFVEVGDRGVFTIARCNVESFNITGNGGAALVTGNGTFSSRETRWKGNAASGEGGVVFGSGRAQVFIDRSRLIENSAGSLGGGVSLTQMSRSVILDSTFADNRAGVFGCDINVNSNPGSIDFSLLARGNAFQAMCDNVLVENPNGAMVFRQNTFAGNGDAIDSTAFVQLFANIFNVDRPSSSMAETGQKNAVENVCDDFGSNAFDSVGYNIGTDNTCDLNDATDMPNTDPMLEAPNDDEHSVPSPGSPAIDAVPLGLIDDDGTPLLPCGYKDAAGLGRPQDANLDGEYECDIGSIEIQGGPDIGPAQSAAFFDPSRNGEGTFTELLPDGRVFVAKFTYAADGSGPAWFVGIGDVIGNSLVVDQVLQPLGGVFGAGFDTDAIDNQEVGSMSFVFSNCATTSDMGRMAFEAREDSGFEDLLVNTQRLTFVVPCDGAASATSGRSGSFFDPARDGEGIFVQWLDDGRVLLIWYTFDPQGNQMWVISSEAEVNGNTVTANMLYPAASTSFGQNFDENEISLQPWGTVTLEYQPGCGSLIFSYDSTAPGYGSGMYNYSRLTTLTGTSCDL